ncbi:MAG: ABC transporter permease, partial [Chloroflexales bacterium]|nr:ABC transporter permease [Chloroflexales bacterium]
ITLLVLVTSALGDGLAQGASEYLDHVGADLIVFQADVDHQLLGSRLGRSRLNEIRRVPGVTAVGPIGVSTSSIVAIDGAPLTSLDISLVGVEPRAPGSPAVFMGAPLADSRAADVVIDRHVHEQLGVPLGSTLTVKVVQAMKEKLYDLRVVGVSEGNKINYTPGIFVSLERWDRIRPQEDPDRNSEDLVFNVAAVTLDDTAAPRDIAALIERTVARVEATDPVTAYRATQGYEDMQSTIGMQQGFVLLIVVLIVGSFFQIQTLQKIAQIGMLEAIGASSRLVIMTLLIQIMITLAVGLAVGGAAVWLLAVTLPASIPVVFSGTKITISLLALLAAGPLAALVAVRTILKIEPLQALGLSS